MGLPARSAFLLSAVVALSGQAHAGPSAADEARAEALFDEGKRLMEQKRYDEACPKLEESLRLDEAGGTLAALALCHQGQGKTATAWAEFKALLALANRTGHADRKRLAEAALAELSPRLCWLTIAVSPEQGALPGFGVRLDGSLLGRGGWGAAFPVDPGPHTVEARADGRKPWQQAFSIGPAPERRSLTIPPLEPAMPAPSAPAAPLASAPAARSASSPPASAPSTAVPLASAPPEATTRRTAAIIAGGVGLGGLLVGGYFGVQALLHQRDADRVCPAQSCADDEAIARSRQASREGWVANVGLGLGVAGVVAAYLLWPTSGAKGSARGRLSLDVAVDPRGGLVGARGRF